MYRNKVLLLPLIVLLLSFGADAALAENEGQESLDKATQLKVTAESLEDLNEVVDELEMALEKGLDEENTEFAEQLLVSSLLQRADLFSAAVFSVSPQDPQRGLRAMQFRQFALNDLQRVVQLDDEQWQAHLQMGKLHLLPLGDSNAARRALTKVVDAEGATVDQKAEALALRSSVQRDTERQIADIDRAVEMQPEKPEFLRLRAQTRFSHKKMDEALADIDRALEMEEDHAASHELRGMILMELERHDDALAAFDRAGELSPEAALPFQHRGELFRKKGDLEKALEQLTKALELAPDNFATLIIRAGVYYELKQTEKALEDVEHALRVQPQRVEPHLMRAEILAASGRMKEAIAQLEKLLELAPDQVHVLSQLGTFYIIDGQPRKAAEIFTRVLEQDSDNASAQRFRADAYLNLGEHDKAIADFEHVLPQYDEDQSVLNNYAWVLATSPDEKLRNGKKALELATKAAEITGYETPHILSTLAAAYAETGDFENAKKWSAKSIELSKKSVEAAETDEQRAERKTEQEQLEKELASYEEGKPVRERQSPKEEAEDAPPPADQTATPNGEAEPTGTGDFPVRDQER
jgi:tetratricopeptide (TPR) repeat protein